MNSKIKDIFKDLKSISKEFFEETGEYDIYTNSKIYEIVTANYFGHKIIKGHSGSFDAEDSNKNPIEYKHYKKSSSNHTWTFNDYSDSTLEKLKNAIVYFVCIDDVKLKLAETIKWYYKVDGQSIAKYIKAKDNKLENTRKMINISPTQLEESCHVKKTFYDPNDAQNIYVDYLDRISDAITRLEKTTSTEYLLTSNKLWELYLAERLGHKINSKQGGKDGKHDAYDGNKKYEYKISQKTTWNFEDISDTVLNELKKLDGIYVATINKKDFKLKNCFLIKVEETVNILRLKRDEKETKYMQEGKKIRRQNISLSKSELDKHNLIIKAIDY